MFYIKTIMRISHVSIKLVKDVKMNCVNYGKQGVKKYSQSKLFFEITYLTHLQDSPKFTYAFAYV